MNLVDSHCHIDGSQFDNDREDIIRRAEESGVKAMLNVGTGSPQDFSFERTVELAKRYPMIFGSVGIHPHDAVEYSDEVEKRLINLVKSCPKIIAWGEIGLDFYYDHSPRDVQKKIFRRQIRVARDLGLPIIIHSREANQETVKILTEECSYPDFRGGIMHCFAGTPEMAEDLMKIGFYISFAGNVTFKKADNLREAARAVPLDKLLLETDCPYLAPVPMRGKRNEPAFVAHTAKFLADFYKIDEKELADQTTKNFFEFFRLN